MLDDERLLNLGWDVDFARFQGWQSHVSMNAFGDRILST